MSRLAAIGVLAAAALIATPSYASVASAGVSPDFRLDAPKDAPAQIETRDRSLTTYQFSVRHVYVLADANAGGDRATAAKPSDTASQPGGCPKSDTGDKPKVAQAKRQLAAGPEPVYLAF